MIIHPTTPNSPHKCKRTPHVYVYSGESPHECTDGRTDGQTDRRTDRRTDGQTDKVNPVYPPHKFLWGVYLLGNVRILVQPQIFEKLNNNSL